MAKNFKDAKLTQSRLNHHIKVSNEHEENELKASKIVAGMTEFDPETTGYVEYTQKTYSNVCIVPFFDVHIGGEGVKLDRILKIIDFVKNTENAFCVFGGDILDNATINGATNVHTSKLNPTRAMELAVKLFEPIKDKILCILAGNHDGESGGRNRDSNYGPAKELAKRLGVKYYPYNVVVRVNLPLKNAKKNKHEVIPYYVFATHGSGKASSKPGAVDVAFKKAMIACSPLGVIPDLVLTGHFHADVNGIYDVKVLKTDAKSKVYGEAQKSIRVESLPTMQEMNMYSSANNMDGNIANTCAINICWLKNPYYSEFTKDSEWEFLGQSTRFNILKTNKNELTKIASDYVKAYSLDKDLEKKIREKYGNNSLNEIAEVIENLR